jgi:hypothetical protein
MHTNTSVSHTHTHTLSHTYIHSHTHTHLKRQRFKSNSLSFWLNDHFPSPGLRPFLSKLIHTFFFIPHYTSFLVTDKSVQHLYPDCPTECFFQLYAFNKTLNLWLYRKVGKWAQHEFLEEIIHSSGDTSHSCFLLVPWNPCVPPTNSHL